MFEFLIVLFCSVNALNTFHSMINTMFNKGLDRYIIVYLDCILVFSPPYTRGKPLQIKSLSIFTPKDKKKLDFLVVAYLAFPAIFVLCYPIPVDSPSHPKHKNLPPIKPIQATKLSWG